MHNKFEENLLSLSVVRSLLLEIIPVGPASMVQGPVIWRARSGEVYSASDLLRHVESCNDIAAEYVADLIRVSREFLKQKATLDDK